MSTKIFYEVSLTHIRDNTKKNFFQVLFIYCKLVDLSLFLMVAPSGIEPPTQGFSVPCSTD